MIVDVEQIEAMRLQTVVQMQELLAIVGPTITVNGTEMAWAPLLEALQRTLDWCDEKLAEYEPYEVRSRGET